MHIMHFFFHGIRILPFVTLSLKHLVWFLVVFRGKTTKIQNLTEKYKLEIDEDLDEEEWHAELDELLDTSNTDLTEDDCERKRCLRRLIDDGYYEPYRVDFGDVCLFNATE